MIEYVKRHTLVIRVQTDETKVSVSLNYNQGQEIPVSAWLQITTIGPKWSIKIKYCSWSCFLNIFFYIYIPNSWTNPIYARIDEL